MSFIPRAWSAASRACSRLPKPRAIRFHDLRHSFQPVEEPVSEVLSMAVNARRGAPVVRNSAGAGFSVTHPNNNPEQLREVEGCGPSWIRTRDQSVMSRQL